MLTALAIKGWRNASVVHQVSEPPLTSVRCALD